MWCKLQRGGSIIVSIVIVQVTSNSFVCLLALLSLSYFTINVKAIIVILGGGLLKKSRGSLTEIPNRIVTQLIHCNIIV
mgnify:CR=1 FL=1